ncbi:hypothetical protein KP509_36G060500 [Ceratopteris richardii]|nr:hypothetical protein KP509_36G060500 [Ceratopteris richardii]
MQADGVVPDAITYVCILKAYATAEKLTKGRILYSELVKRGFERELLIRSTLLDVYVKQGALEEAQEVFTRCRPHDVVMWNALIAGLTDRGKPDEALLYFKQMHQEGCVPDMVTFAATLKASSILQVRSSSQALHALLTKQGMEALVGSALVDAYCKLNLFMEAQSVFKGLYEHDIFASTTLVACYVEQGHGGDALDSFVQMDLDKVVLDSVSCVCSLKACGHSGALNKGMGLHCDIIKRGLEAESGVSNILIDMYSKCGVFDTSIKLFDKLRVKDLVTWNMHLALYSHSGDSDKATIVFVAISAEGLTPDEVSFGCVLKAYSHAGLMNDGLFFLVAMLRDYQFVPTLEHYTSIVDLVGRTGCIGMALRMVNAMPMHPDTTAWHSLLAACQKQGDAEAGRYTFEQIMELDREAIASYVCMYNICSDSKGIDTHDGKPQ